MNYKEEPTQTFNGYSIEVYGKDFDLDVEYEDDYYGPQTISLKALDVYLNLKEYFKGTEHE